MKITKEQVQRITKAITAIERDCLIDDDVSGGYLPEPYKSAIAEVYIVIDEVETPKPIEEQSVCRLNFTLQTRKDCARWNNSNEGCMFCVDRIKKDNPYTPTTK